MALRKCRKCGSWVLPDARACPSCGIESPIAIGSAGRSADGSVVSILLFSAVGAVAGFFAARILRNGDAVAVTAWSLTGILGGWLLGDLVGNLFRASSATVPPSPEPEPAVAISVEPPAAIDVPSPQPQSELETPPAELAAEPLPTTTEFASASPIDEAEPEAEAEDEPTFAVPNEPELNTEPNEAESEEVEVDSIIVFHSTESDEAAGLPQDEAEQDLPPTEQHEDHPTTPVPPQQITVHRIRRRLS